MLEPALAFHRRPIDPYWTSPSFPTGGARDALGIETLSEGILADLLPGINNQTSRARYYSFWAWVVHDFILDPTTTHTQAAFYEWLRRREDTLILAYLAHGCAGGSAGAQQGGGVWQGGALEAYPIDWKSLLSVDGGGYQLYYRGALQEMNIIRVSEGSPHDDLTSAVGLPLAEAYAESVATTEFVRSYLDARLLSKPIIQDFAEQGCLCRLPQQPAERRALIDAFFRFDSQDTYAIKRLASLCFFLDVIGQSQGRSLNQWDLRETLYFWSFGENHPYIPEGNFIEPAQRWRCFMLRQWFVFAAESLWSLFLKRVEIEPVSAAQYLGWLLTELDLQGLADTQGLALPTADARVLTAEAFYRAVYQALPQGALQPGPTSLSTPLNERRLAAPLWSTAIASDPQSRAGHALIMLALMYWRCQPWREQPGWRYLTDSYASGRLPMESYLRHVERAFQEEWTLAHWLGWLHQHYIWLQHRRVTLEKLVARGQETAFFELIDDNRGNGNGSAATSEEPLMRATGLDSPKMNAPRFPSALQILVDLALIESVPGNGYRLLPDGEALLERYRSYAPPTQPEVNDEATR